MNQLPIVIFLPVLAIGVINTSLQFSIAKLITWWLYTQINFHARKLNVLLATNQIFLNCIQFDQEIVASSHPKLKSYLYNCEQTIYETEFLNVWYFTSSNRIHRTRNQNRLKLLMVFEIYFLVPCVCHKFSRLDL